jgi:ABC-type bacteriocin/lantibiotic exporter with double-glycine peptidase domain
MTELWIALGGAAATFISAFCTWFFTKKKYNAEVEHDKIENMHSSLDFYREVEASTQSLLNELLVKYQANLEENIKLVQEVQELRIEVNTLTTILKNELGDSFDISKYKVDLVTA